ncbi:DUF6572 domain-containing protein [Streptococcus entericus]|uniref:DUF6572 domain-containing protein n=1 Tax=Streptococcus entericus TaxID=155680 RepID=UPI000370DAF5|nr:DUF6572 domain-containing protein [Streptococcus entericus]
MTVDEHDKIDGMGIADDNSTELLLMIADHLPWDDVLWHLELLQEKINAYLSFVASGQFKETYPDHAIQAISLLVYAKETVPQEGLDFLGRVNQQLQAFPDYQFSIQLHS